jgi:hypothetical protein
MVCRCASTAGLFGVVGLAAGLAFGAGALVGATEKPAQPEGEMSPDAMVEAMMAANPITEHHEHLEQFVGVWDGVVKAEIPGGGAFESKGVMTNEMVMGGRFLKQTWEGEIFGASFTGQAYMGYSTAHGTHQSVWFDSTANAMYFYEGSCNEDGTVFTMMGKETDPASGMTLDTKDVITIHDPDRTSMVRTYITPEGEAPGFTITYSRQK